MGKSFRKNMDSIWKHMKDNTPTLTTWRNQNQFQCHEKVTSPTGLVITRRSIRVKPSFRNSTSKLGSIEVWVNGEIYMDSASIFWANMLSHKPQSIFWGQNTKSGGDVGGLIWAFMGNLAWVGTLMLMHAGTLPPPILLVKTKKKRSKKVPANYIGVSKNGFRN